jgi:hypothetical protein
VKENIENIFSIVKKYNIHNVSLDVMYFISGRRRGYGEVEVVGDKGRF